MSKRKRDPLEECRDTIEGDDGLVSRIGLYNVRQQVNRGQAVSDNATDTTRALDNLTKVFSKGPAYTSIIQARRNHQSLYLSYQGTPPVMGLTEVQINATYPLLNSVVNSKSDNDKAALFTQLLANENPIVLALYEDYQEGIQQQIRRLGRNEVAQRDELEKKLKNRRNLNAQDIAEFTNEKFASFLSEQDLDAIKGHDLLNKQIVVVPHDRYNQEHLGVHVEVKGLRYARDQNRDANSFNIGLASSKGESPGCCTGCSAELEALRQNKYTIYRTADFPGNFPAQNYRASGNVTRDDKVYLQFAEVIRSRAPDPTSFRLTGYTRLLESVDDSIRNLREDGHHLKRAGKHAGEDHDIRESFAASNPNNAELLDRMSKQAVITADIDLKAVDIKERVTPVKVGKVEFVAESNHIRDHAVNTKTLIDRIVSGDIGKDTVIAIERKSYGKNLGVPDVIMLASILEHNEKNPAKQLKVPEEITKDSLIYQDAILYNTAKKHGVKVVGLEGRNLKAGKELPEEYNAAREDYMASRITQLTDKGYNVIAYVGSAHVKKLEKAVGSKLDNKPSVENTPNQVSEELQQMAASIGQQARAHVTPTSSTTSSISVLPNENQPIKRNSGVGGR